MRFDEREEWLGLRIQVQLLEGLRAAACSIAAYVQIFAFLDSSSRRHANDVIARSATRPFLDSRKRVPHFFPTSHPCIATLDPGCLASLRDTDLRLSPKSTRLPRPHLSKKPVSRSGSHNPSQ
jgi:hypothetical protein